SVTNVAGYAYLATLNTALAYWLWFRGLAQLPASSATFLGLLSPVAAMVIGWAVLSQALTAVQITGAVVALRATIGGALGSVGTRSSNEQERVVASAASACAGQSMPRSRRSLAT